MHFQRKLAKQRQTHLSHAHRKYFASANLSRASGDSRVQILEFNIRLFNSEQLIELILNLTSIRIISIHTCEMRENMVTQLFSFKNPKRFLQEWPFTKTHYGDTVFGAYSKYSLVLQKRKSKLWFAQLI